MTQNETQGKTPLPEVACSTNAFYIMPCGVKHQITGRGRDAEEMTRNYFTAVDRLKAEYEKRAKRGQIDAGKLLAVVACWMKKAETMPGMSLRLVKAAQLVQAGAVTPEADGAYDVQSQSEPEKRYWVTDGTCACLDALQHAHLDKYLCKHGAAVALYKKLTAGS